MVTSALYSPWRPLRDEAESALNGADWLLPGFDDGQLDDFIEIATGRRVPVDHSRTKASAAQSTWTVVPLTAGVHLTVGRSSTTTGVSPALREI